MAVTKDDLFDLIDAAKEKFAQRSYSPEGIRMEHDNDPFTPSWKIWIVGPGSVDLGLVMAGDIYHIPGKFKSKGRADKAFAKYVRWFAEWKNENS